MKKRSVLNSPRLLEFKKKKNKILKRKIIVSFLGFLFFFIIITFLSKLERFNLNTINIVGNEVIETEKIEEIVKAKIKGNYYYLFPKTNFILYPKKNIEEDLKNKFKRIKEISVNDLNINTLEIKIEERVASHIYCGESFKHFESLEEEKCYFMDEDGFIFDDAPYFSGNVYLKFYGKTVTNEGDPMGYYFYQPIFKGLLSFKDNLEKIGIKPVIFYVQDDGDIKAYLPLSTSAVGPEIRLKSDSDFEKIVENLQSVLTTEPLKTEFKEKYSSLLYIDLRFGNKVFYKFK